MPSAAPIATKSNPRSDAHRLQPSPQVVSLLPRDRRRAVSTKVFARSLGEHMARNRHGRAIASFFPQQMARFRAAASATGLTHDAMAAQVFAAMQADETNDRGADATDQAIARTQRALLAVLVENYGREIRIEGWIPGEIVKGPFIGSGLSKKWQRSMPCATVSTAAALDKSMFRIGTNCCREKVTALDANS